MFACPCLFNLQHLFLKNDFSVVDYDEVEKTAAKKCDEEADSDSFEEVTQEMCTEKTIYFFARADREKDDW